MEQLSGQYIDDPIKVKTLLRLISLKILRDDDFQKEIKGVYVYPGVRHIRIDFNETKPEQD